MADAEPAGTVRSEPDRSAAGRSGGAAAPCVLVTGASKGIGEACALRLARDGFRVFAGVRRSEDGEALAVEARHAIVPIILDITNADHIREVAARIDAECGTRGLQALVNNAGVAVAGPLEFLPIDELRRQLEINVTAQLAVTQALLPLLRRSRAGARPDHRAGRIVFMSSVSGRSALPFTGAYAASKHALEAIGDALRVELLPFGLRVVLVEPGVIATPIWQTSRAAAEHWMDDAPETMQEYYGAVLDGMRRRVASGMHGLPPERVADVVSHALTSQRPRSRYVVGRIARARVIAQALMPTAMRDRLIATAIKRLERRETRPGKAAQSGGPDAS